MRKMIIAGNWKMNTEIDTAVRLAESIRDHVGDKEDPVVLLCPPAPFLPIVHEAIKDSPLKMGGQNVYFEPYGAFTGEMSDTMLQNVGCEYVLIGHSERRSIFKEDDMLINMKVKHVLEGNLTPVLCIGELLKEREAGQTFNVVERQLKDGLKGVKLKTGFEVVIAYEPVWAIGTGVTASPDQAEEVHEFIRKYFIKLYNKELANNITIQYGGSVKPGNAKELLSKENIDGALVGGASLKAESFNGIIDAVL